MRLTKFAKTIKRIVAPSVSAGLKPMLITHWKRALALGFLSWLLLAAEYSA